MTRVRRVAALEAAMNPPDDRSCFLFIDHYADGSYRPRTCPLGRELDAKLTPCGKCTVRQDHRRRVVFKHIPLREGRELSSRPDAASH